MVDGQPNDAKSLGHSALLKSEVVSSKELRSSDWKQNVHLQISHDAKKPDLRGSDQVRHKSACTVIEAA